MSSIIPLKLFNQNGKIKPSSAESTFATAIFNPASQLQLQGQKKYQTIPFPKSKTLTNITKYHFFFQLKRITKEIFKAKKVSTSPKNKPCHTRLATFTNKYSGLVYSNNSLGVHPT